MPKKRERISDELLISKGVWALDPSLPLSTRQVGLITGLGIDQLKERRRTRPPKPPYPYRGDDDKRGSAVWYPLGEALAYKRERLPRTLPLDFEQPNAPVIHRASAFDSPTPQLSPMPADHARDQVGSVLEVLSRLLVSAQAAQTPQVARPRSRSRAALPAPTAPPTAAPRKPVQLTLRQAIQLYTEAESRGLKPNTWAQRRRAFESFAASVGEGVPVSAIGREAVGEWAHGMLLAGTSVQPGPKRQAGATKRTVGNMVSHLAQLFAFLGTRGKLSGANPAKGAVVFSKKEKAARRAEGFQWEAFDLVALQLIFKPDNLARVRTEHVRWAALIGLYTGARVSEIAQLYLADFAEEQGVPCMRITTDSDGQSLKTAASRRVVPIHPDLVQLGLLDRVDRLRREEKTRLFPEMRIDGRAGAGNSISKGFGFHLNRLGIRPRRSTGTLGFHSLRKTVVQELQASGLPAERRRAFVGHEAGDDVHQADYMRAWTAFELAELFPGLRWNRWLQLDSIRPLLK